MLDAFCVIQVWGMHTLTLCSQIVSTRQLIFVLGKIVTVDFQACNTIVEANKST